MGSYCIIFLAPYLWVFWTFEPDLKKFPHLLRLRYRVHRNEMDVHRDEWRAWKHNAFKNSTWKVFRARGDGMMVLGGWGLANRNRGLRQSLHFNLCPGGWRNQCTLIPQSSAYLRLETHWLSEIRLFSYSWQGTANTNTNTYPLMHESLKCAHQYPWC